MMCDASRCSNTLGRCADCPRLSPYDVTYTGDESVDCYCARPASRSPHPHQPGLDCPNTAVSRIHHLSHKPGPTFMQIHDEPQKSPTEELALAIVRLNERVSELEKRLNER